MLSHQQAPIPPIRQRRLELPEGLVGLLERMLAKDPMSRPDSARVVAESLGPWCVGADLLDLLDRALCSDTPESPTRPAIVNTTDQAAADVSEPMALLGTAGHPRGGDVSTAVPESGPIRGRAGPRRWSLPILTLATVFLLGLLVAWRFLRPTHRRPRRRFRFPRKDR